MTAQPRPACPNFYSIATKNVGFRSFLLLKVLKEGYIFVEAGLLIVCLDDKTHSRNDDKSKSILLVHCLTQIITGVLPWDFYRDDDSGTLLPLR